MVLTGSAVDIADAPPFWPVLSAIRNAARAEPDTDVAALLRQWLTRLPQAGPDAGPPVVLLDLLHQLVVDLAERRPVLLVVDDLQWADRSTRDLVAYLVANLVREPVLVLATFRTDSPRRTPDLDVALAELRRLRKVTTLDVAPLPARRAGGAGGRLGARPARAPGPGLAAFGGQRVHRRGDRPGRARR